MGWVVVLLELVDILGGVLHGGEVQGHDRHLGSGGGGLCLGAVQVNPYGHLLVLG